MFAFLKKAISLTRVQSISWAVFSSEGSDGRICFQGHPGGWQSSLSALHFVDWKLLLAPKAAAVNIKICG
jgi:hypothetical protein